MNSLRRHLTRRLAVGTFLVAAAGLVLTFVYLQFELLEQFDNTLTSRARTIGSLVRIDDDTGRLEFELTERAMAEYGPSREPDYFQIWDAGGAVVARSSSLVRGDLPRAPAGTRLYGRARYFYMTLPDGREGRAIEYLVDPAAEDDDRDAPPAPSTAPPVALVLATDLADLNEAFRHMLGMFALVIAAVSVGTVLTVKRLVRRGLRPLDDVGEAVARLGPGMLDARVETAPLPEELRPIAGKLNELLSRIEEAFQRERRFTSNVAHELRTPIAELRTLAEVALRWPDEAGDERSENRQAFADVLGVARQMEAMVAALLAMARSDAGQQPVELKPVNLDEVVDEAWRPYAAAAAARGLTAEFDVAPDVVVATDRAVLSAALGNLFANAVTYAPPRLSISCRARPDGAAGERETIEIANANDSLTDADMSYLTEPFWRKDAARSNGANSGLGLALVAAYARLMGAEFSVALPSPDLFVARLSLARAEAATPERMPVQSPEPVAR